jgi:hypothetical protein
MVVVLGPYELVPLKKLFLVYLPFLHWISDFWVFSLLSSLNILVINTLSDVLLA